MLNIFQYTFAAFLATIIGALLVIAAMTLFSPQRVEAACGTGQPAACEVCEGAGGLWTPGATAAAGTCGPKVGSGEPKLFDGDDSIIGNVIDILTFVVGAVSVIMLIIGGLRYVLSNGDANAVTSAKNTILYAIVGIVVAFAARAIVLFVVGEI